MNKKSSSFFRLDEQVFFTMGALCILSLIIMAFRWGSHTPCSPVKIAVTSTDLIENHLLSFKAETQLGKTFSWNFGDSTTDEQGGDIINHKYNKPGMYTVTVLVNGECSDIQNILIGAAPVVVDHNVKPLIIRPDTAYVNERTYFHDASPGSSKWKWNFGEKSDVDATSRDADFTYSTPGTKTITLTVNDRSDLVDSKTIFVMERPVIKNIPKTKDPVVVYPARPVLPQNPNTPPLVNPSLPETPKKEEPAKPKAPAVTDVQLKDMLWQVAAGTKSAADFSQYMCGKSTIQVVYNNDVMSLEKMCEDIKGMKTKKIKSINVIPTITDNCLNSLNVTVKKKTIFGL